MELINIHLQETPLTSTENKYIEGNLKYLEENFQERFYKISLEEKLKRKVPSLFETQVGLAEKFLKCCKYVPCGDIGDEPVKKKKKKRRAVAALNFADISASFESDSAIRERSRSVDSKDADQALCLMEQNTDEVLGWAPPADFADGPSGGSFNILQAEACSMMIQTAKSAAPSLALGYQSFGKTAERAIGCLARCAPVPPSASLFGSASFSFGAPASYTPLKLAANIPEIHISKMPSYELAAFQVQEEAEVNIFGSNLLVSQRPEEKSIHDIRSKKLELLNIVSMALMYSSNLSDSQDAYRIVLEKFLGEVMLFDPEFILKVALYARQELHIRAVTNFLLSYAALHPSTRIYLEKYFDASIVLPSDWIEVAEYFKALKGETKQCALPASLRCVMKKTFAKFDEYQLAKYNRDKTKKKSKGEKKSEEQVNELTECCAEESEEEKITAPKKFTLKRLIRTLHIDSPAEYVMSLLGKKYPESYAAFQASGLCGTWDFSKAGQRMKLPIPVTWETQISANGNKPSIWESLIDSKKLPYMATLRNLRNLILSGISAGHHEKVRRYLENKKAVINSRQLPMQFFEAYKAVANIEKLLEGEEGGHTLDKKDAKGKTVAKWKIEKMQKMQEKMKKVSLSLLKQYKSAISNALEISSSNNLHPIPGKTLIICEIAPPKKDVKVKDKAYETCVMMGLMCMKACEDSKMNVLHWTDEPDVISLNKDDSFLNILMEICQRYESMDRSSKHPIHGSDDASDRNISSLKRVLDYYLKPQTMLSEKLDHLVLLRTSTDDADSCMKDVMTSFLHKYRQIVNSNLLYTDVNFSLSNKSFVEGNSSEKDVYLCGSSSSFIKFIAERSSGGQLACVENIDVKYKLPEISESKRARSYDASNPTDAQTTVPLNCRLPKWHTVRIFISSTFKDMVSERDLLVRYVFPELRKRAASVFIRIAEIDLRWGITEADSVSKKAAEFCLLEAQKSDLFVGFIGERYGTIYEFDAPDAPELKWVKDCPPGLSITELEMCAAALRKKNKKAAEKTAFFYFRDSSFTSHVPQKWISYFTSEDDLSKMKVEALKAKIKSNKFKVFDKYPCYWAGIFENKPILAGLDILGERVLQDLWIAIKEIHEAEPFCDDVSEEDTYQQNLINSQNFYVGKINSPVNSIINKIKSERGIFVICGDIGSGKTAFCIDLLQSLNNYIVIKFFIGVSPRSRELPYMIQYICNSIWHHLSVSMPLPDFSHDVVNQFSDILLEASNCSGGNDIILLIDGLDHLETRDQRLDWLPLFLPHNVKVICSASESSQAFKVLCDRLDRGDAISIENLLPLKQSDREEFIRSYLENYRKTLDEGAFSNQMLKIVTKKDSAIPMYLRIVCDFLRIYASFDNLITMLQNLPSTLPLLLQEIILQMENEFGTVLIQTSLTLLCISKIGLEDNDLHYILSFIKSGKEQKTPLSYTELKEKIMSLEPENLLSQIVYCSLMHVINTFAYGQVRQKSSTLIGTEFEVIVRKYYLNKNYSSNSKYLHSVLAAYYHNMCDPDNDEKYKGQSAFAVRGLLYHMFSGCLYKELSVLLCSHYFLETVFKTKADDELLEYYSSLLFDVLQTDKKIRREIDYNNLYSFYDFISRNFHIFHQYPQAVLQQALNEPIDSVTHLKNGLTFYSLENLSRSHVMDCRLATLCGFVKNITASAGEKQKSFTLLGSEDGYLKVLDLSTRKIIHSIKSHASAITCICFAGKKQICLSSVDGTLSLWDIENFSRIFVLEGHRHNVTSCCADPSGCILFSSGWDNSVRLWSLRDGRSISAIEDFRCPVNCIDHHPAKQEIACGLWNGSIEIWDTVSMTRKLAFSSSSGSVKSITYTPDGVNIIAAFMQSEISVWSSEEGIKMSSLKGHVLPVKSLFYSCEENILISGSDDCTIKVWSAMSGSNVCTVTECKFCSINIMEFMSENLLAVAFQNSEIWIIDINSGIPIKKFKKISDTVSSFSKYSLINVENEDSTVNWFERSLIFGTQSGKIMIANLLDSSVVRRDEMDSKITALTHNHTVILSGSADGNIGIFSYPDNKLSKVVSGAHTGSVTTFSFTTKQEKLFAFSASFDNVLKLWSIDSSPELNKLDMSLEQEVFNKHRDSVTCSVFYPQPSWNSTDSSSSLINNLFTGSHDNDIISWSEGSEKIFKGLQSSIINIACTEDFVLGCGNDGAVIMWSKTGKVVSSIPRLELSSTTLTFHITEDNFKKFVVTFAFVEQDGSVTISKPFQKTYTCSLEGHNKPITSCCTAENGEIVSCSLDGTVNLWRAPANVPENHLIHSTSVTGVILSSSCDFALSSDSQGNVILWKMDVTSLSSPLTYATKKSYVGGFIRKLSWMKDNKFVCAVSQIINNEEKHFINILSYEHSSVSEKEAYSIRLGKCHMFVSEVMCLDSCPVTDVIVIGLKSGDVALISSEGEQLIHVCEDWLLGICFYSRSKMSDYFCVSFVDGSIKLFAVADFMTCGFWGRPDAFATYKPLDSSDGSKFTNVVCCGSNRTVCCGDMQGSLRIYANHSLIFSEKVHSDSITGMCIIGPYLFTSSLDRTVKGWKMSPFKQVFQFHSHVPITSLNAPKLEFDEADPSRHLLLLGTTSGDVHLLKFCCK